MKYAGIGSRTTPTDILSKMMDIGELLAREKWVLRSGGADGADSAFEIGCNRGNGHKEIFLPWPYFNKSTSELIRPSKAAYELAAKIHPAWNKLSFGATALHARNCHQILGWELNDPVNVVICWTEGGKQVGGTATAIKLAKQHKIPILNLGCPTVKDFHYDELLRICNINRQA
jgi:hypothetical protein